MPSDGSPAAKKSVFIVEDDTALLSMLANMLAAKGIEVLKAEDGSDGLNRIPKEKPDLLIIDIDLPKLSGTTMLRELRERGCMIPAMVLTNSSHQINVANATELGVKEYLVKADWEIDQVVEKILGHLKLS